MRFEALQSFSGPYGGFVAGSVGEAPDAVVREWIKIGYAKPAPPAEERAELPRPSEQAVTRKRK